jgi:hypothetical protein
VDDPSEPAFTDVVDVAMRAYDYAPASEPTLTTTLKVLQTIRGLKVGKAPGPNGIPNRVLRYLANGATTFLTKVFNAVLWRPYFPPVWKHARVVAILKSVKVPTLPSSYRPVSLLDTVGKVFEILLTRVPQQVNEQFGFRPKHSTTLQLARLVERVNRSYDERRLIATVFLDVAKAFDTVWVKGLLYKLTVLNFPSYLVKTVSSYIDCRIFQTSFQLATSTHRVMRAGLAQGGLVSPVLFSLSVRDIPTPSRHVELTQYADNMALIATSRYLSVPFGYLDAYLGRVVLWHLDLRIAINVSKSTAVLFAKTARCFRQLRPMFFHGEPIEWVEAARYHGVTLDTQLTWSAHVNQVRKRTAQRLGVLGPHLKREVACASETVCCSTSSSFDL